MLVHDELGDRATRSAQVAAQATTAEAAVRFDAQLEQVLAATEAAAASPAGLERGTARLRTAGTVISVAVLDPDLTTVRAFIGDRSRAPVSFAAEAAAVFAAARDLGEARLGDFAGPGQLVALAPIYRGSPVGTAERRSLADGFVVAVVDAAHAVAGSVPSPRRRLGPPAQPRAAGGRTRAGTPRPDGRPCRRRRGEHVRLRGHRRTG